MKPRNLIVMLFVLFSPLALAQMQPPSYSFEPKLTRVRFDKPRTGVTVTEETTAELIIRGCVELGVLSLRTMGKEDLAKTAVKEANRYRGDTVRLYQTTDKTTEYNRKCKRSHFEKGYNQWGQRVLQEICDELVEFDPYTATWNKMDAWIFRCEYDASRYPEVQAKLLQERPEAYEDRGLHFFGKGEYDRAIADFTEAIRLEPKDAMAYHNRGYTYAMKEDYGPAITDYTEAIRLKPDALTYVNRGAALAMKEDYDRAIADHTEAIRLDPAFAPAYHGRGVSYAMKLDYGRAIADYTEAIRLNPKYTQAYYNRGVSYGEKHDYDRAIADYTAAIRLNPQYASAYYNRALAYERKGDAAHAAADRQKVKALAGKQ